MNVTVKLLSVQGCVLKMAGWPPIIAHRLC